MRLPLFVAACLLPIALSGPAPNSKNKDDCEWDGQDGHHPRHTCLSDHAAAIIVSKLEGFFVKINTAEAKKYLAPDFHVFSDSTNFVTPNASHVVSRIVLLWTFCHCLAHETPLIQYGFVLNTLSLSPLLILSLLILPPSTWYSYADNLQPGAAVADSRAAFIGQQIASQQNGPGPLFKTLNIFHSCNTITFRWSLGFQPVAVTGIDLVIIEPNSYLIKTDYSEFNGVGLLSNFGCTPVCPSG